MPIFNNNTLWQCSILAIDKFKNISSAKLVDRVKEIICHHHGHPSWLTFGHGGTLDETATGVLVVGTGLGCKLLSNFLHGSKIYVVKGCLGIETDTLNECGQIVNEIAYDHVTEDLLVSKTKQFIGNILQVPPKYSALKLDGRRIADLARDGIEVSLAPRSVNCYSIKLLSFEPPFFNLEVRSGGGFYVRSLIHDLGKTLGTCAHVQELRRTRHGFLSEKDVLSPEDLTYDNLVINAQRIGQKPEYKKMYQSFTKNISKFAKRHNKKELWFDPT